MTNVLGDEHGPSNVKRGAGAMRRGSFMDKTIHINEIQARRASQRRPSSMVANDNVAMLRRLSSMESLEMSTDWESQKRSTIRHELSRTVAKGDSDTESESDEEDPDIMKMSLLKSVPIFKTFTEQQFKMASESLEEVRAVPGETVVRQGDDGREMFLLSEGRALVTRRVNFRDNNEPAKLLATLTPPAWFGETSILTVETRNANVVAGPDGLRLWKLTREKFVAAR